MIQAAEHRRNEKRSRMATWTLKTVTMIMIVIVSHMIYHITRIEKEKCYISGMVTDGRIICTHTETKEMMIIDPERIDDHDLWLYKKIVILKDHKGRIIRMY